MKFEMTWRNKWLTADAKTFVDMVETSRTAANTLEEMEKDGLVLDSDGGPDDYMHMFTDDPVLAKKYGMYEREPDEDEPDDLFDEDEPAGDEVSVPA